MTFLAGAGPVSVASKKRAQLQNAMGGMWGLEACVRLKGQLGRESA